MNALLVLQRAAILAVACTVSFAAAQQPLVIKALAEKKVSELPRGDLFWQIETFGSRKQADAAAGPWSLVAESTGKVWLFTLGPAGGSSSNGTKIAEIGPIPRISARQYLLRINDASGPPGSVTSVHSHLGSEAFFVLTGEKHSWRRRAETGGGWAGRTWPDRGRRHAGFEQRLDRAARARHVRCRREQALFVTSLDALATCSRWCPTTRSSVRRPSAPSPARSRLDRVRYANGK